jgi:hypothetical protein
MNVQHRTSNVEHPTKKEKSERLKSLEERKCNVRLSTSNFQLGLK